MDGEGCSTPAGAGTGLPARTGLRRGRSPRSCPRPPCADGPRGLRRERGGTVPSGGAGPQPAAHLHTVIKFRLSTAALRDGTLFLRAETLSPPKPRDAISAGQGRWSPRCWRGAFVPGLPLSRMLRLPPPHADAKEADEEAPVLSPLLLPPPRSRRARGSGGSGGDARGPPAGAARPPRSRQPSRHSAAERRRRQPISARGARRRRRLAALPGAAGSPQGRAAPEGGPPGEPCRSPSVRKIVGFL